jgi:hypothetical protein
MFDTYVYNVYEIFRDQTGIALERLLDAQRARAKIRNLFESGYDEDECVWELQAELDTMQVHV